MKIFPTTARIPIKVGEITYWISPMTHGGRMELASYIVRNGGAEMKADLAYMYKCLQLCLKKVEGIENMDGSPYEIKFDESGIATDESMADIGQAISTNQAAIAAASMLAKIDDPKIPGVEVDMGRVYLEDSKKKDSSPTP